VGDDAFRQASRNWMQSQINASMESVTRGGQDVAVLNVEKLAKNLGVSLEGGPRRKAIEKLLEGTGVTVQDLAELVNAIKIAEIGDPNAFMARRAALGGVSALVGAAGVGAAMSGAAGAGVSVPAAIIMGMGARKFSEILANPARLKALTRSFAPDLSDVQRQALILRVLGREGVGPSGPAPGDFTAPDNTEEKQ
jgi:hypothetical protein